MAEKGSEDREEELGHRQVIYKGWGWGKEDGALAISLLNRFGSVTILNEHIHQLAQRVEGNMTFLATRSTAFPKPAPCTAPSLGPMLVPADKPRTFLGLSTVNVVQGYKPLAIIDRTLAELIGDRT
jgi:Icc protein